MEKIKAVLIDTSSWIEALRVSGRNDVRERVLNLMLDGSAAWCDIIAVELWNGAKGDYEKKKLKEFEKEIICLETSSEVWQRAKELARECRKAGYTVPTADLVITACAFTHKAPIEHCDEHIESIARIHGPKAT